MIRIGLTGGIGTGKSRVARLLEQCGAAVISADQLAHAVVAPDQPAFQHVVNQFGAGVVQADGTLDRKQLATIVFSDPKARQALEAIIHPAVRAAAKDRLAALAQQPQPPQVVVNEVPLLFETNRAQDFDQVWVVYASDETALARATARDQATPEQIKARMRAQMPLADKVKRADVVINNDGDWSHTEQQVLAAWRTLCQQYNLTEDGLGRP